MGIVVDSVPSCTPGKIRTCDLCLRKTADTNIRDVTDDTSIYCPSAYLEAARTGVGRIGGDPEGLRPAVPMSASWKCCAALAVSSASCAMRAASDGVSAENAGRGSDGDLFPHLLSAMGPDRRHPLKARAVRAPGSAGLSALTGCRRPGKGSPCR